MKTAYETIVEIVKSIAQPFKRSDILKALRVSGHDQFTNAAVAGWINRAKVKGDIILGDGPGDYVRPGSSVSIAKPKPVRPPEPKQPIDDYSPAVMAKLSSLSQSCDLGALELVNGARFSETVS